MAERIWLRKRIGELTSVVSSKFRLAYASSRTKPELSNRANQRPQRIATDYLLFLLAVGVSPRERKALDWVYTLVSCFVVSVCGCPFTGFTFITHHSYSILLFYRKTNRFRHSQNCYFVVCLLSFHKNNGSSFRTPFV